MGDRYLTVFDAAVKQCIQGTTFFQYTQPDQDSAIILKFPSPTMSLTVVYVSAAFALKVLSSKAILFQAHTSHTSLWGHVPKEQGHLSNALVRSESQYMEESITQIFYKTKTV